MKQFLLLLKAKEELDYSPEQLEMRLADYRQWVETIKDLHISDQRLDRTGAMVISRNEVEMDGPFLEAKEIIAGYINIQAHDLNHAIEIAQSSPLLKYFRILVQPFA